MNCCEANVNIALKIFKRNLKKTRQIVSCQIKMPSTSKKVPSTSKKDKKQRNHLTIQEKLEIIELRNNGASFAKIAREKGTYE